MQHGSKTEMIRIAAPDGIPVVDESLRLPGRGGYLHPRAECLQKFIRSKAKEFRSLRLRLSLDQRLRIAELIQARLDSKAALE
jgi:predicted RNA-binding protein YlxR (DUF448 family)